MNTGVNVHDLHALRAAIDPIHGWWQHESGEKLYRLVKNSKLDVLELGSWCGRSTAWIAAALKAREADPRRVVFAVDTWEGTPGEEVHQELIASLRDGSLYDVFVSNMQRLELCPWVIPVKSMTAECPFNSDMYDVLLIDADHSYEAVKADFERFSPAIPVGGHVVFDDIPTWHGPTKFHREIPMDTWKLVEYWPNQAVFRRVK